MGARSRWGGRRGTRSSRVRSSAGGSLVWRSGCGFFRRLRYALMMVAGPFSTFVVAAVADLVAVLVEDPEIYDPRVTRVMGIGGLGILGWFLCA